VFVVNFMEPDHMTGAIFHFCEIQCLNCRGVEPPQLFAQPPKHDALGYPGGVSFNPPAVVNDAESPVCNGNDNE
jgi:hypothetical protein